MDANADELFRLLESLLEKKQASVIILRLKVFLRISVDTEIIANIFHFVLEV